MQEIIMAVVVVEIMVVGAAVDMELIPGVGRGRSMHRN